MPYSMRAKLRIRAIRILREWRSNIIVWVVQWIGGSAMMSAIGNALWREFHRAPLDWYFIGTVFVVGLVLVVIGVWFQQKHSIYTEEKLREIEAKIPSIMVNGVPVSDPPSKLLPLSESHDATCKALRDIAEEDAKRISKRVLIAYHKGFRFNPGSDPYLDIVIVLTNYSVFELAMMGKLEGHTMYGGDDLPIEPRVVDPAEPTSLSVRHGDSSSFRIRQYISTNVADRMVAERPRKVPIDFRTLKITFEMRLEGMPVRTFCVNGPVITLDEATRIP